MLLHFQENKDLSRKCLYCLLVDVVRSTYAKLAHLDFINKKVIELNFQTQHPLSFSVVYVLLPMFSLT